MTAKQITCTCTAYKFPHRKHGGACNACKHGINLDTDHCEECEAGDGEGYRPEPSECLTDQERNPGYRGW